MSKQKQKQVNNDKCKFELMPVEFEERIIDVLNFGNTKYDRDSWREGSVEQYYAALRRHINAWRKGDKVDEESGFSHLAHAACNIMFIMYLDEDKTWRT